MCWEKPACRENGKFLPELFVAVCEMMWAELLVITLFGHISCSPAGIQKLPVAIVDPDRVPSVACGFPRRWPFSLLERRETIALAVTPDHDAFQPCPLRDGLVDAGIAFADCLAREDGIIRCIPLDTTAKETFNVLLFVSDVYMGAKKRTVEAEWGSEYGHMLYYDDTR